MSAEVEYRALTGVDGPAVLAFARELPEHDLLFLARDLTHPKVIDAWLDGVAGGEIASDAAFSEGRMIGFTALITDALSWSPHVGEVRAIVAADWRGKGVGRALIERAVRAAIERGLEKLTARMTPDQHGAITVFEELGFRAEAMLRDHVRTRSGDTFDLAILSLDVAANAAQRARLGIAPATT